MVAQVIKKGQTMALIATYHKIAIPVEFLPTFLENAVLCETTYEDGEERISKVDKVGKVEMYDGEEFLQAIAQQKLTGT